TTRRPTPSVSGHADLRAGVAGDPGREDRPIRARPASRLCRAPLTYLSDRQPTPATAASFQRTHATIVTTRRSSTRPVTPPVRAPSPRARHSPALSAVRASTRPRTVCLARHDRTAGLGGPAFHSHVARGRTLMPRVPRRRPTPESRRWEGPGWLRT